MPPRPAAVVVERDLRAAILANIRYESDRPVFFPGNLTTPYRILSHFALPDGSEACVVCLSVTGSQMMADPRDAARRVLAAAVFAQDEFGANIIGLTSLTSSVTMQGKWLADRREVRAALTHGDSYASVLTVDGVEQALSRTGHKGGEALVGVLGAYGLIGRAVSLTLARAGHRLLLVGPNAHKLARLALEMRVDSDRIRTSTDVRSLVAADLIVTATSNPSALVTPECVKPATTPVIIYEVSVPPNLPYDDYRRLREARPNAIKVDGAMASIPGVNIGFSIPGVAEGTTYSCWAETFLQAMEGDIAHHVGDIDLDHMARTREWALRHGFGHAPFTCFGERLADSDFAAS